MSESHLHRPIADGLIAALNEIFSERRHAEKVVDKNLKNQKKWGAKDRRLFAETLYEMVRWWRRLLVLRGEKWSDERFLSGQALDEDLLWDLLGLWWQVRGRELPPWRRWKLQNKAADRWEQMETRADRESIPDWLDQWGLKELGERWPAILNAMNRPADVYLRVNSLKTQTASLQRRLQEEQIETEQVGPWTLRLPKRAPVFRTLAFREGWFEMQDLASQQVAPLVDPQSGDRVIDACAGAGGKSLHLAALMKNKGKIIALDVHQWKLDELKKRTRRAGVDTVETRLIEGSKSLKRLESSADKLLLDVPCSGLGVLRRNPDAKWKLSPEELERLTQLQARLLSEYSAMVKPKGQMVYSTCSILPSENSSQVRRFLQEAGSKWRLDQELELWPDQQAGDGFYAARLTRI